MRLGIVICLLLLFIISLQGEPCSYQFSSSNGKEGNFTSLNYPKPYPNDGYCHYVFLGTLDERIRISWIHFDLEEGKEQGGCLYDYIDVFTVDIDLMKNLQNRLCGSKIPSPILSIQQRVELVFKSDYKGRNTGFQGQYEFIAENWQPFKSDPACGPDIISGVGGIITSPGFPDPYPEGTECTWMIRVANDKNILLNVIDLDMGPSVHCVHSYIEIYNGFASKSAPPAKKLCGQPFFLEPSHLEFKSRTYRVVIRFHGKRDNRYGGKGFRMAWTAVGLPKFTQNEAGEYIEEPCLAFHCHGGEYCIDTEGLLCNPLARYCIDKSLRCNDIPNCGISDHSDESGCLKHILLIAMAVILPVIFILSLVITIIICRRRRQNVKKSLSQEQALDADVNLRKLERSPSLKRKAVNNSPKKTYAATYGVLCKNNSPTEIERHYQHSPAHGQTWRRTPSPRLQAYHYSSVAYGESESKQATV